MLKKLKQKFKIYKYKKSIDAHLKEYIKERNHSIKVDEIPHLKEYYKRYFKIHYTETLIKMLEMQEAMNERLADMELELESM